MIHKNTKRAGRTKAIKVGSKKTKLNKLRTKKQKLKPVGTKTMKDKFTNIYKKRNRNNVFLDVL